MFSSPKTRYSPLLLTPMTRWDSYRLVHHAGRTPPEVRDYSARFATVSTIAPPATLDYRPWMFGVVDQGGEGSCTAEALVAAVEYVKRRACGLGQPLSAQFVYDMRLDPATSADGMTYDDAFGVIASAGVCYERSLAYGTQTSRADLEANAALMSEAEQYRIGWPYIRLGGLGSCSVDTVKSALVKYGPLPIQVGVYNSGSEMWRQQNSGQQIRGFHAMTIVGYDAAAFIVRNSWGTDWGQCGYTSLPFDQLPLVHDLYAVVDRPSPPYRGPSMLTGGDYECKSRKRCCCCRCRCCRCCAIM